MSFNIQSSESDAYFQTRESTGDSLVKTCDPDEIQSILHSKHAVRPLLMQNIVGESMVWIDGPSWLVRRKIS